MIRQLAAAAALFVLVGCSAPEPTAPPLPEPSPAPADVVLEPARIDIPRINAGSELVPTGKTPDGGWEIPPLSRPELASWFAPGPEPGEVGRPAVVLGHVNGSGRPGVFARLHELAPGDEVVVTDVGGRTRVFAVTRVQQAPKSGFPDEEALAGTAVPEIRIITCGGELQRNNGHGRYTDNVIVYATARA